MVEKNTDSKEKLTYAASLSELKKALGRSLGLLNFKNGRMLWETYEVFSTGRLVIQVFNKPGSENRYVFVFRESGLTVFSGEENDQNIDFGLSNESLKLKIEHNGKESLVDSLSGGITIADWLTESIKDGKLSPLKITLQHDFVVAE